MELVTITNSLSLMPSELLFLQIQDLLDAMEMQQYKDGFEREKISGEILAELTEEDLQKELGVASRIHRVRLLKIMTGHHSARDILAA